MGVLVRFFQPWPAGSCTVRPHLHPRTPPPPSSYSLHLPLVPRAMSLVRIRKKKTREREREIYSKNIYLKTPSHCNIVGAPERDPRGGSLSKNEALMKNRSAGSREWGKSGWHRSAHSSGLPWNRVLACLEPVGFGFRVSGFMLMMFVCLFRVRGLP